MLDKIELALAAEDGNEVFEEPVSVTLLAFLSNCILAPVTLAPSFNRKSPVLFICSCNIEDAVVNSLACTGKPGLNKTLKKSLFSSKSSK